MAISNQIYGAHGIGKWDAETKRYVPIGGGSRSRLALQIKGVRPYRGFAGIDSVRQAQIESINQLYSNMEEGLDRISQTETYLARDKNLAEALAEDAVEQKEFAETAPSRQLEIEAAPDMPVPESLPPVIPLAQVEYEAKMAKMSQEPAPFETLETVSAQQPAPVETVATMPAQQPAPEQPPPAPQPQEERPRRHPDDEILFTFEL